MSLGEIEMTCGNRSREKVKGYTLKDGEINKVVYVHDYEQMIEDMKLIKKTKIPLAKKNPFPDEDVLGELSEV